MSQDYSACGKQVPYDHPIDWARNLWYTYFLGVQTLQFHVDFMVWERLLNDNPKLRGLVELGSGRGGLSLYFALQCFQRDLNFMTFDTQFPLAIETKVGQLLKLQEQCAVGDLFTDTKATLLTCIQDWPKPIVLLCDNGVKPLEFKTFVPYLSAGDIVGVHDWQNEFGPDDVTDALKPLVKPYYVHECEEMGSLTRFWIRV